MPTDLKRWNGTTWVSLLADLRGPLYIVNTSAVTTVAALNVDSYPGPGVALRRSTGLTDDPYLAFYDRANLRIGYLQGRAASVTGPGLRLNAEQSQPLQLYALGAEQVRIGALDNEPVRVIANNTAWGYIGFWNSGMTIRRGYMGMRIDTNMRVWADDGALELGNAGANPMILYTNNLERARFDSAGHFMTAGMTVPSVVNDGVYIHAVNSTVNAINSLLNQPLFISNKQGAGNAGGADVMHFRLANTARGSITHPTTTTTAFNTSSDYRLKDVLGPVDSPLEQLALLKPCHVRWKENGEEQDTFLAHEVAEVVPVAVTGEKDVVVTEEDVEAGATNPAGTIVPQQLDTSKLIPLITAAVQELAQRVEALESA